MAFTRSKFLSLPLSAQHKKVAELIKALYYDFDPHLLDQIVQLESWMNLPTLSSSSLEDLSHRFHFHWAKTNLGLSEHALLVKSQDRLKPQKSPLDWVIYLDHIRSAHNIGSILRTMEALQVGQVAFSQDMATLEHPQVQKASMGAYQWVQVYQGSLDELPRPWIALETHRQAQSLGEFSFPKQGTLILGNEEFGVSHHWLDKVDAILEIPLVGRKNSLNVSNSFSIAAWQIRNTGRR